MATLSTKSNGRHVVQWGRDKGRKTIHLGKMSRKDAQAVRGHIDSILSAKACGQPLPLATAYWLGSVGDLLHDKLARHSVVPPRKPAVVFELRRLCDEFIARRTDLKERTLTNLRQAGNSLVVFFGAGRDAATINRAEARDWRRAAAERYAQATVAAFVKKARQMFVDAVDRELIPRNPFAGVKAGSMANAARNVYVPAADVLAAIAVCPDAEWRLIFALARFAGLRTPSETFALKWSHVSWDRGRIVVPSPKTEHIEGKAERVVPIFPELLPWLREAFEAAPEGAQYVIQTNRITKPNTRAGKIVTRAGLKQWPRLFQNLRASCETDLANRFPVHVACEWIGNSAAIAQKHYLAVTEEHFSLAAECGVKPVVAAAVAVPANA